MKIQRKIKALLVKPYELPKEIVIDNNLHSKQECVIGNIEYYNTPNYPDVIFICNEESKLNGMEPNRDVKDDILFGPFLILGDDSEIGEDRSLSDDQILKYKKIFDRDSIDKTEELLVKIKLRNELEKNYEL